MTPFFKAFLAAVACLVIVFLLSSKANADTVVGVHVGSVHFPAQEFNNRNPGMYIAHDFTGLSTAAPWLDGRYVVGTYYNSERKESYYVGRIYPVFSNFDIVVGAISGYKKARILPMVVPSVHFAVYGGWDARIHYLPKIASDGAHTVHLSVERSF